ncbi:sensor histidine kinase [Pedobacter sp. MR2016-24]|uniref:sensor histidine kinase n=1 Tax=Pedobacter sp. MR2016-24 TaxID=2994466 RepID=UPI0022478E70|nr:sensor histidine kinase [Pedobacter sp. MR2016-24]MCX2486095.1 sensor histidine kinase [Pedobacter sp. MR2016-24]
MKKIYLLLICLLGMNNMFAQQQIPLNEHRYLDSLDQVLRQQHPDTAKANASFLLVDYWKFKDTVKSKNYLRNGRQFAAKSPYLKALYYFYEGQYYFNRDTKRASAAFKKAEEMLSAFPTKKAYGNRAAAWFNYALMNKDKKGYEFIISITLDKAIPNALKAGNMAMVAHYYTQLSTILMNNYQFAKAGLYVQKAIGILEKESPKSATLVFAYLSGVSIYCYENKAPKAKPLLNKALALLKPYPESLNYPLYYYNEVLYYSTINDLNHALLSTEKGIVLAKKYNQKQLFQQFIFRRYTIYSQQKSYEKARQLLLDIVKEGTLVADINDRAAIYAELAKTNQSLEDYKEAFQWQKRYSAVADSIHNSQTKVKINELETKYQTAQNRQKIAVLQAQNKQTILTAKNQRLNSWLLAMGCVCLIIVLGFVILTAKKNRRLAAQKEINFKQQLKEVEQQQQLHIAKAMLDGEEHERERVARDLHDGLGGMLAGVKIGLSGWSNNNAGISGDKDLYRIITQLDNSVGELRRIARNMVPETLLKFGLEVALKDLSEFYMQDDLQVDFQAYNIEKDIALTVQLNIYRIIQELFSNAIRHACASHIMLQCSQNENIFFITFEDDGCGFDTAILTTKKGMGLNNLKTRIAFLKGQFEIQSLVNEGTTINIEINTNAEG